MTQRDWGSLQCASGPATLAATLLEQLASTDSAQRRTAHVELWKAFWSSEKWYSGQPALIEELLALAADGATPDRALPLDLAAEIASRGSGDKAAGVNPAAPEYQETLGQAVWGAARSGESVAASLLTHSDPAVRIAAAKFLLLLGSGAPSALAAQIAVESDPVCRAVMFHALGCFIARGATGLDSTLEAGLTDSAPLAAAFALTGLLVAKKRSLDATAMTALTEAMILPREPRIPLKGGLVDEHVMEIAFDIGGKDALTDLMVNACNLAAERGSAPEERSKEWVEQSLLHTFGRGAFRARTALTPRQLDIAARLSTHEFAGPFLLVGLPSKRSVRRHWLELDGPNALGKVVTATVSGKPIEAPLWWALLQLREEGSEPLEAFQQSVPNQLLLDARLEYQLLEKDKDFTDRDLGVDPIFNAITALGAAAADWGKRALNALSAKKLKFNSFATLAFLAVSQGMPESEQFDEKWDALIDPTNLRMPAYEAGFQAIVKHVPTERLEQSYLGLIDRFEAFGAKRAAGHLAACLTPQVVEAMLTAVDSEDCDEAEVVVDALTQLKDHPVVAAAVATYSAKESPLKGLLASLQPN
ncbi:MAG: hypothetical protein IPK82_07900 [Polyangiaceae bacterium]|nr:hypothetical protein [Polyangiaceae bacterium]